MTMKKIFLSADIEGTCGIVHWDETKKNHGDYGYFANQMTREVAAACKGILRGGAEEVFVKDAHDSARNLNPAMLPRNVSIFRGWGSDPYSMMSGLDESFSGALFTGYHSAAGMDGNPLAHTMNGQNNYVKINGEIASELMINCLTCAMMKVPVRFVSGDEALCRWIRERVPAVKTVATNRGIGRGAVSMHPDEAVEEIEKAAVSAMGIATEDGMFPFPEYFEVEIFFKEHALARRAGFYPGCTQTESHRVAYESDDYMDVLRFIMFCL